jgi:hypothetical protein
MSLDVKHIQIPQEGEYTKEIEQANGKSFDRKVNRTLGLVATAALAASLHADNLTYMALGFTQGNVEDYMEDPGTVIRESHPELFEIPEEENPETVRDHVTQGVRWAAEGLGLNQEDAAQVLNAMDIGLVHGKYQAAKALYHLRYLINGLAIAITTAFIAALTYLAGLLKNRFKEGANKRVEKTRTKHVEDIYRILRGVKAALMSLDPNERQSIDTAEVREQLAQAEEAAAIFDTELETAYYPDPIAVYVPDEPVQTEHAPALAELNDKTVVEPDTDAEELTPAQRFLADLGSDFDPAEFELDYGKDYEDNTGDEAELPAEEAVKQEQEA